MDKSVSKDAWKSRSDPDAIAWARRLLRQFDAALDAEERGEEVPVRLIVRETRNGGLILEIERRPAPGR